MSKKHRTSKTGHANKNEPTYIVRLTESERRQLLVLIQEDRD